MTVNAQTIEITRGEGNTKLDDFSKHIHTNESNVIWSEADNTLRKLAKSSPIAASDKVDFVVTFEDGQEYEGTYLLKNDDATKSGELLADHIKWNLDYAMQYTRDDKARLAYSNFKESYQIGS